MTANNDFRQELQCSRARFFLADFHVHSPASQDLVDDERFAALSSDEQSRLSKMRGFSGGPGEYESALIDTNAFPVEDYVSLLKDHRDALARELHLPEGQDWAIIGITDHNVCTYACKVAQHAWEQRASNRLIILPGIEITVAFPVPDTNGRTTAHIILVFSPKTEAQQIYSAIRDASEAQWDFGRTLEVADLTAFIQKIRHHAQFPAIALAAHIDTGQGLRERTAEAIREFWRSEAEYARTFEELRLLRGEQADGAQPSFETTQLTEKLGEVEADMPSEDAVALECLRLIGRCGFDALQVRDDRSGRHYRRLHRFEARMGRASPIICSDAHTVAKAFRCRDEQVPLVKLPALSAACTEEDIFLGLRDGAFRFGETRFATHPLAPIATWICGIEIAPDAQGAKEFWPFSGERRRFVLPLSPNLNCLIGGRGSGKSAAIEALSFATEPEFLPKRDNALFLEDCQRRAEATLSGCNVRICWTVLTGQGEFLDKNAVFASRYFHSSGRHSAIVFSDLGGAEMPPPDLPVKVFRLHEIEELVDEPGKLLTFFDSLCGNELETVQGQIVEMLGKLHKNRQELIRIANTLCQLTCETSPLRSYVYRKEQYDAVNSEGVRERYKNLDHATEAERTGSGALQAWQGLRQDYNVGERRDEIKAFFDALSEDTLDEEGDIRPFVEPLREGILDATPTGDKSRRDRVVESMGVLEAELLATDKALGGAAQDIGDRAKEERERMEREGLPVGGREREAKKSEFDEAIAALNQYRTLMKEWDDARTDRNTFFEQLVAACQKRTEVRRAKATDVSDNLRRELDPAILVIEVDAQPTAEKGQFKQWMNEHLFPPHTHSKDAKIEALITSDLQPGALREILLGNGGFPTVDKESVSAGRIDADAASKCHEHAWAMRKLAPERNDSEMTPEKWGELPLEIQNGLWEFPVTDGETIALDEARVSAVLELDEVLFDDVPEIRMMDRPGEMQGPRPLGELSPGQRCSAVLPIILLNGSCPLIVDQPEDNLDNRLIREVVVKILSSIKLKRQVVLATHNPNLPVLGDVEQAVVLAAIEDKKANLEATGDLDNARVVRLITDIMEGGREAFQHRYSVYQPYWKGPVAEE